MSSREKSNAIILNHSLRGPRPRHAVACVLAGAICLSAVAVAQESLQRRETFRFWSVFADESTPECYAATAPTETRSSLPISRRGDPLLLISTFPSDNVRNELSVNLGYRPRADATMTLEIGDSRFELFSEDETAWLAASDQGRTVIQAMRRGRVASVTATSQRGNQITDEYSLIGFTAAVSRADEICGR